MMIGARALPRGFEAVGDRGGAVRIDREDRVTAREGVGELRAGLDGIQEHGVRTARS